jgi:hypothetical protein
MHNNSNRLQIFDKKLLLMIREGTLQTTILKLWKYIDTNYLWNTITLLQNIKLLHEDTNDKR